MSHPDDGQLHALVDGELSPAEAAELDAHFRTCDDCRCRASSAPVSARRATSFDAAGSGVASFRGPDGGIAWTVSAAGAAAEDGMAAGACSCAIRVVVWGRSVSQPTVTTSSALAASPSRR